MEEIRVLLYCILLFDEVCCVHLNRAFLIMWKTSNHILCLWDRLIVEHWSAFESAIRCFQCACISIWSCFQCACYVLVMCLRRMFAICLHLLFDLLARCLYTCYCFWGSTYSIRPCRIITVLLPRCNLFILHPILHRSVQQRASYQQSDFPCCLTLGDNFLSDINDVIFATIEHSRTGIIGSSQSAFVPCNAQRVINHAKQSSPPRLHNP